MDFHSSFTDIAKQEENGVQISLWITGAVSIFWMSLWIVEILVGCKKSH